MTQTIKFVLAACAGLALVSPAFANTKGAGKGPPSFETLDVDGNGQITEAEMRTHGVARFEGMDTDKDGFLSKAELEAAGTKRAQKRSARMMSHLDSNEDGQLSLEEVQKRGRAGKMLSRMDKDEDGSVSREEYDTARAHMKKRHKKN
ncbi:calcium-binding protein [Ascidiaceihabitans sp.]|uniref:EF-hand domain-containing protein n=1 Tax=Ascidiaceihabitans sp. TaxID=1872644 RepID=UPI003297E7D2